MVKLTAAMIGDSPQYTNTLRDREIDLRGYKLSVIENLGATLVSIFIIDENITNWWLKIYFSTFEEQKFWYYSALLTKQLEKKLWKKIAS